MLGGQLVEIPFEDKLPEYMRKLSLSKIAQEVYENIKHSSTVMEDRMELLPTLDNFQRDTFRWWYSYRDKDGNDRTGWQYQFEMSFS